MHGNLQHRDDDSSSDAESTAPVHLARKKRKPLMEKKRRARINASLEQLKKLVLDAMKKDSARYSKLEKADILELTVRHLREGQQQQMNVAMTHDGSVASKYKAGFVECASEVSRYLSSVDGLGHEVTLRLMQHLTKCIQRSDVGNGISYTNVSPQASYSPHYSVQPLQIQIPSATTCSSLPGSPQPANLPPTPPSSADHSFSSSSSSSTSFQFNESTSPIQQQHHFGSQMNSQVSQAAYIRQQQQQHMMSRTEVLPLRSRENIKVVQSPQSITSSSSKCHENKRTIRRYSPYPMSATCNSSVNTAPRGLKRNDNITGQHHHIVVKEENMWRPW